LTAQQLAKQQTRASEWHNAQALCCFRATTAIMNARRQLATRFEQCLDSRLRARRQPRTTSHRRSDRNSAASAGALREAAQAGSVGKAFVAIGRQGGVRGYWKGNLPQVLRVIPYSAAQLCGYEVFKKAFAKEGEAGGQLSVERKLAAGACAGMLSTLVRAGTPVVLGFCAHRRARRLACSAGATVPSAPGADHPRVAVGAVASNADTCEHQCR
jgi:Mitochondrial carrier protein